MKKLFLYLWYFATADTKELRLEAQRSALTWCKERHTYHFTDQYRLDFNAYSRAFINTRCHMAATIKLQKLGL